MLITCEQCGKQVEKPKGRRFCGRSCSISWQYASGKRRCALNDVPVYDRWVAKYGEEEADARWNLWIEKMSVVTKGPRNPMYGKNRPDLSTMNSLQKGLTWEEIHGLEKASNMRKHASEKFSGSKNPAYGRVYKSAGRSVKGWYKGVFFRSLYELSFLLHLECVDGVDIKCDVEYETHVIPYTHGTYIPDFYVPSQNVLYEVKPFRLTTTQRNIAKFESARVYCASCNIEFRVVTENDFKKYSFEELRCLNQITWDERSFQYFRKK